MKNDLTKESPLEDFISSNDKLLSVLGVFIAIVTLTTGSTNWALNIVAFVSVGGVVLVGYNILNKIDKKSQSLQLQIFRYIILWGGTAFVIYWLMEFRLLWNMVLWIPVTLVVLACMIWSLLPIVRKLRLTRFLLGIGVEKMRWYQKLCRVFCALVCFGFSCMIGTWISTGTNLIFDSIV